MLLLPASVAAQTSFVRLHGTVSETVALSVLPNSIQDADVVSSGNTVRITLSGANANDAVIRLPLLMRSNSGFRISATVESQTAALGQLSITGVHATGTLVSPQAISELNVPQHFDLDFSRPLLVLTGPRVSLGGTLDSPGNALQITVLIRLRPQSTGPWLVHLTFAGSAGPLIQ